ncbi:hypothetical protein EV368DRAFT_86535 [Lentinula lateritia]|nr:hypothetical protein EV368DRAFT_86535 [Lentinula lateritia]
MLSQSEVARLLDRCVDEESPELAMEEILSAYVAWKLIRGQSCALVLQKLRYLTIYLRVTERQWVLATIREVIMVTATELSLGGVSTSLGKQVWNDFRRKLSTTSHALNTDPEYGGPITFHGLLSIDEPSVLHMNGNIISNTTNTTGSRTNATGDSLATTFYTEAAATLNSSSLSKSHWHLFRRRREQGVMRDEQTAWSERPRWILLWFLTRPHLAGRSNMLQMLAPEYRSLVPAYTSFRGTLPMYVSDRLRSRDS